MNLNISSTSSFDNILSLLSTNFESNQVGKILSFMLIFLKFKSQLRDNVLSHNHVLFLNEFTSLVLTHFSIIEIIVSSLFNDFIAISRLFQSICKK
jgi:hypothetical protein